MSGVKRLRIVLSSPFLATIIGLGESNRKRRSRNVVASENKPISEKRTAE